MHKTIAGYEGERIRILIADDFDIYRHGLETILLNLGFEVDTACNGIDTIAKISEFKPDILLLDMIMPGINGFDVIRELRRQNTSSPTIIAMSANMNSMVMMQCMQEGQCDFLSKPIRIDELLNKIYSGTGMKRIYEMK